MYLCTQSKNTKITYTLKWSHIRFRTLVHEEEIYRKWKNAPLGAVTTEARSRCLQPGRERTRAACLSWVLAPPELPSPGRTGDIWPLCLCSGRLSLQGPQTHCWMPRVWFSPCLYFLMISQGKGCWWRGRQIGGLKSFRLFLFEKKAKKESAKTGVSMSDTGTMTWK